MGYCDAIAESKGQAQKKAGRSLRCRYAFKFRRMTFAYND
jgi:hypothetical protein